MRWYESKKITNFFRCVFVTLFESGKYTCKKAVNNFWEQPWCCDLEKIPTTFVFISKSFLYFVRQFKINMNFKTHYWCLAMNVKNTVGVGELENHFRTLRVEFLLKTESGYLRDAEVN